MNKFLLTILFALASILSDCSVSKFTVQHVSTNKTFKSMDEARLRELEDLDKKAPLKIIKKNIELLEDQEVLLTVHFRLHQTASKQDIDTFVERVENMLDAQLDTANVSVLSKATNILVDIPYNSKTATVIVGTKNSEEDSVFKAYLH